MSGIRRLISRLTYHDQYVAARKYLEQKSSFEELGLITASLVHDLSIPISTMSNLVSLLEQRCEKDPEAMDLLRKLERQLERIQNSLMLISVVRGGAEYFGPLMKKTEILYLLHSAIKDVRRQFGLSDSIMLKAERGRHEFLFVKGDPAMIKQAVSLILTNSIEAIREAERGRGLITINVSRAKEFVVVDIVDNGCGVRDERLSSLEELINPKSHVGSGKKGLGLFTVARILSLHDGSIKINTKFGEGTTVSLAFPLWNTTKKTS